MVIVSIMIVKLIKIIFTKLELNRQKLVVSSTLIRFFPFKMATLGNKCKMAAVARDKQDGSGRKTIQKNPGIPVARINNKYST